MKFSLETKISVLISIPLFAFVAISGFYLKNNWRDYQDAKRTMIVTNLFDRTAKLVKDLQMERSNLGLLLISSLSLDQVQKQRPNVDKDIEDFQGLLKLSNLSEKVMVSQASLPQTLKELRQRVDTEISGEVFEDYNDIITKLIVFEVNVARQISISEVQTSLLSINILEQARESGAQLQSMLLPVLLSNAPLSPVSLTKMEKLYSGISRNLESPILDVSPEVQKNLADFRQNEEWGMVSLIYSSILAKAGEGQYGIDLGGFNEAMAKALLLLDGPIGQILDETKTHVDTLTSSITRSVLYMSVTILLSLILIFTFVRSFTRKLSKSLVQIADNLLNGAEAVAVASKEVASAADGLSSATATQANSLRGATASVEQISTMIRANADNGVQANDLSTVAKSAAEKGETEISVLITAMQELVESSKRIEEIVKVIDDISFQTNLLALNASVEAARAGEQGKGFAVVADAVRALAQKSAISAREIANLVKENVAKTERSSNVASVSKDVLTEIIKNVKQVAEFNTQIATASLEQSREIEAITKTMNHLDEITQNNATTSESAAQSADALSGQSGGLKDAIASLVEIVHGN